MKTTDISNVLEEFVESNNRSLLIDGPWGAEKLTRLKSLLINKKTNVNVITYLFLAQIVLMN